MQVCFYGLCSLYMCYIHKEQNNTVSGPTMKSHLPLLLHLQILLVLVCLVSLGWKGYTPVLSLLTGRNFFVGFELFLYFPLFVSVLKKFCVCLCT